MCCFGAATVRERTCCFGAATVRERTCCFAAATVRERLCFRTAIAGKRREKTLATWPQVVAQARHHPHQRPAPPRHANQVQPPHEVQVLRNIPDAPQLPRQHDGDQHPRHRRILPAELRFFPHRKPGVEHHQRRAHGQQRGQCAPTEIARARGVNQVRRDPDQHQRRRPATRREPASERRAAATQPRRQRQRERQHEANVNACHRRQRQRVALQVHARRRGKDQCQRGHQRRKRPPPRAPALPIALRRVHTLRMIPCPLYFVLRTSSSTNPIANSGTTLAPTTTGRNP